VVRAWRNRLQKPRRCDRKRAWCRSEWHTPQKSMSKATSLSPTACLQHARELSHKGQNAAPARHALRIAARTA
jgi:hypothetical protein